MKRVSVAAAMRRIPVVLHEHANHTDTPWFQKVADYTLAPYTDIAIAVSKSTAEFTMRARLVPAERTHVVYLGAPLDEFARPRSADDIARARVELGVPGGAPVIGTVTRLMPSKGNQYFVEAITHLAGTHPDARFVIVGEGELQPELEAQARSLGVADRLIFAGFQRDVAAAYSTFDVAVFPSLWEGTPLTAFEALAMGKAIVATDADGLSDILTAGRDALIVPKRDAAALADGIARVLSSGAADHARDRRTGDGGALRHRRVRAAHGAALRPAARDVARHASTGHPDGRPALPGRAPVMIAGGQPTPVWRDPGYLVCAFIGVVLLGMAATVNFPRASLGFQSDGATYYSMAHSIAADGDFAFERRDLVRVWHEYPTGPEGIFLKKGKTVGLDVSGTWPFIAVTRGPDPRVDRLYYGKSFIYPLFAAPFVKLFGTNGFMILHVALLVAALAAAYAFLAAQGEAVPSIGGRRGLRVRLGRTRVSRVAHARDVQPLHRPAGALLLGLQDGGATHPARTLGTLPEERRVRPRGGRAAGHGHVFEAAQRARPGARRPRGALAATVEEDDHPRARHGRDDGGPVCRERRHLRRVQLPGRRTQHVLRHHGIPVPAARADVRHHRDVEDDERRAHRRVVQSRGADRGAAAQRRVLHLRAAHRVAGGTSSPACCRCCCWRCSAATGARCRGPRRLAPRLPPSR